jgi:hypothetical protein
VQLVQQPFEILLLTPQIFLLLKAKGTINFGKNTIAGVA